MKKRKPFFLGLLVGLGCVAPQVWSASSNDPEIKGLMRRYTEVEAQLDRSVHYLRTETVDGITTTRQAWFNGANDLIKAAVERSGPAGRELTEWVAEDFDSYTAFVLTRKETPGSGGETQIEESRRYFVAGDLARELRKSGRFKAGESLDTVKLPNVSVDPSKPSKDQRAEEQRSRALNEFLSEPEKIAAELRAAGPPQSDPFASGKGDSDKFRVIHGSVSPDGRYAIALGFARPQIEWDNFIDPESEVEGKHTYYAENEEDVKNYVVDLAAQKILGQTGCQYFGTRKRYNHRECSLIWSSDSTNFVQVWSDKWADTACAAGQIAPGPKLAGVVDLLQLLDKKTYSYLKKRPDDTPGLSISVEQLGNDGRMQVEVCSSISSGERKGETLFRLAESVQLRKTANGVQAEVSNIRRLPAER